MKLSSLRLAGILFIVSTCLILSTCKKKHNNITGSGGKNTNPLTVGPDGGVVANKDSTVILVIPPKALSSKVTFSFKKITSGYPDGNISPVWDIGPSGTKFDTAAVLDMEFNSADIPDTVNAIDLRLATISNNDWDTLKSASDTINQKVYGLVHHVSEFGIISKTESAAKPAITRVKPDSGMVGDTVIVYGNDFGNDPGSVQIAFNQSPANILSLSNTQIKTTVPDGATTGFVHVIVNGYVATGPSFSVLKASNNLTITNVQPAKGKIGTAVTIKGAGFGTDPSKLNVYFGNTKAQVSKLTTTEIDTKVPDGAVKGPIHVIKGEMVAQADFKVILPAPVISSIVPDSTHRGDTITINGDNFSSDPTKDEILFNVSSLAVLVNPSSATTTQLKVTVPQKAMTDTVKVRVGNNTATGPVVTIMRPAPTISGISPTSGKPGTSVTINGSNFIAGTNGLVDNFVYFGGIRALNVTSATATQLNVTVPDSAETGPVTVNVLGQVAKGPTFTVQHAKPVINSISPTSGGSGTQVTISGDNFSSDTTNDEVFFNGVRAAISSATQTQIVASVPQNASTGPVSVTVYDQKVQGPTFTVKQPGEAKMTAFWGLTSDENVSDYLVSAYVNEDTTVYNDGDFYFEQTEKGPYSSGNRPVVFDMSTCKPIQGEDITKVGNANNGFNLKLNVTPDANSHTRTYYVASDFNTVITDSAGAHKTIKITFDGSVRADTADGYVSSTRGDVMAFSTDAQAGYDLNHHHFFLHIDNPTGHSISLKVNWNVTATTQTDDDKVKAQSGLGFDLVSKSTNGCYTSNNTFTGLSVYSAYSDWSNANSNPVGSKSFTIPTGSTTLLLNLVSTLKAYSQRDQSGRGYYQNYNGGTATIDGTIKITIKK